MKLSPDPTLPSIHRFAHKDLLPGIIIETFKNIPEAWPTVFRSAKTLTQVAALPYVVIGRRVEILLVTSRRRGVWLLPRGWPIEGMSYTMSAAREAMEEAGLVGEIGRSVLGDYTYEKRTGHGYRVPCRVFIYPLLVTEQRLDWPEKAERKQRWCDVESAASLVRQEELHEFLDALSDVPDLVGRLATYHQPNRRDT
jgi:8-oxo-dGTP pyrophosphatase MutT (NUDIX family)